MNTIRYSDVGFNGHNYANENDVITKAWTDRQPLEIKSSFR